MNDAFLMLLQYYMNVLMSRFAVGEFGFFLFDRKALVVPSERVRVAPTENRLFVPLIL